jgi:hypothetical protein
MFERHAITVMVAAASAPQPETGRGLNGPPSTMPES